MNGSVTIITPVYNAMPYLPDYLDSLLCQDHRPLEVILVNDGSDDDSLYVMEKYSRMMKDKGMECLLIPISHQGQAGAINAALPYVSGQYLTWCDADDILLKDSIEKKAAWLTDNPEYGMVRSNGYEADASTGMIIKEDATDADKAKTDIFEDILLDGTYCYSGCYMIRTSLFFECYPERTIVLSSEGQNLQMLLPAASRTRCGFIDEPLHRYNRRTGSHSSVKRSYTGAAERIKNFTALRLELLKYCECDRDIYIQKCFDLEKKALCSLAETAAKQIRKRSSEKNTGNGEI